ncbi:precorrin-3B methylase and precorrin-6x reductase [Pelotomaculum thermopropionicum SI]|uniref:Precorrin-3B methylase and precorrin-6x reductase n=1 Tax=Pelotomaculum thermopropionicum (strain DSM 13744 / JCM 10971 / SI) TaxID=370438 RepID=A5D3Q7_PELTS|nr:precorrin-3B methylase and precorrin-6x reductase [Pelotomaculum thermopropionicum SI]
MSRRARELLQEAEVVVGYRSYLRLLEGILHPWQERVESRMREEVDRARRAVALALSGRKVAVVSSGDPGIYGMAGLVLEVLLSTGRQDQVDFQVVPGITAASSAAALLGAPLMHDFAVISLSDLLTPWEVILKRIEAAARGDFVVVFYNPKSKKRVYQLQAAREVLLRYRKPETPVGVVTGAGRPGQQVVLTDLARLPQAEVNMQSVVMVGNSQSYVKDGYLITPRGYPLPGSGATGGTILVLAGTKEGRELAAVLAAAGHRVVASAATPYGGALLRETGLAVREGRLDAAGLQKLIEEEGVKGILDATHPFAGEITRLAREAARASGISYLRWERPPASLPADDPLIRRVRDWEEAAECLAALGKERVFLAVGIKPLPFFLNHPALRRCRFLVRVLPVPGSLRACIQLGLQPEQIVALQGPGTQKFNEALLEEYRAEILVTKESGETGGVGEKIAAARARKIPVIVVERPPDPGGEGERSTVSSREEVLRWADGIAATNENFVRFLQDQRGNGN